jgi:hypothetical protein
MINLNGVLTALTEELASVRFQMTDEFFTFHAADKETDSRITS